MEYRKLLKLRTLRPTRKMMEMARADQGRMERHRWGTEVSYKYGVYLRCQVQEGILKAAFFLAEHMRLGAEKPVYELFIKKETGEFATWDVLQGKWRTAKVDMLEWPRYAWNSGRYINPEGYKTIKHYLGMECGGYKAILEYQQEVRKKALKEKYRRETQAWDLVMEQIPPLPKDWTWWVEKQGMEQQYLFYEYTRKKEKAGWCTRCEKEVPVKHPRHNEYGVCPRCRRKVQYKAKGKAGSFYTDRETAYLIQRYEEGFVIREFALQKYYRKGEYEIPQRDCFCERERTIYDRELNGRVFYYGLYKQDHMRWIETSERSYYLHWCRSLEGRVYQRTLPSLQKKELQKTGLAEYARNCDKINPVFYLAGVKRTPQLEQLVKAGLSNLAKEWLRERDSTWYGPGKDLAKRLRIDKARLKRLRERNGGALFLAWLREEKDADTQYQDTDLVYLEQNRIPPEQMEGIRKRMSLKKACRYLRKQETLSGRRAKELLSDYEDYLLLAGRLKMEIEKEIIYKPKDLKKAHDRAVALCGGRNAARRAGEIAERFPDIDEICTEIKEKYEYSEPDYRILAPERIEDIIKEGEVLGHCLHSSDRYFERIQKRESYIVFLRKAEEPDKPYYTLEIEPDGTARQKRTVGDNQNADFKEAEQFILRWQQEVQKRLTKEDETLAEKSRLLRIEEFRELREEKKKVWHGALAGKLLVEVLEADLMEARKAEMS